MINSTVFFLLLSHAAMRRKSHSLIQVIQRNKLNRCKLSKHMFKFEADFYSTVSAIEWCALDLVAGTASLL